MVARLRGWVEHEAAGGVLLVIAALLALIVANSPLVGMYQYFLDLPVVVQVGTFAIAKPLVLWINDGLMAIFFFVVGLEIKREMLEGHLSSPQQVVLPGIAALAGIAAPALIYAALNKHDAVAVQGWAIPSATDIAFALGVFSLFGRHIPVTLKLFLLAVAIFDDIGAIVIIAIFYSQDLSTLSLSVALLGLLVLLVMNWFCVQRQSAYIVVGVVVWAAVLKSGVHATLAGFAVAWFIPLTVPNHDSGHTLLPRLEHAIHPWVTFLILPVFAFANAGVQLVGVSLAHLFNPVSLGIAAGLFVGKQVGIFGACFLAIKLGLAKLPSGATWLQLYGTALLCGIGFTMSLFIGSLAFEHADPAYLTSVKVGVLMGSVVSAIAGALVLRRARKKGLEVEAPE